jgi:ABC-2 type transport system ATP-binding protein
MNAMIRLENLGKRFGDRIAIRGVTLEIPAGEIFGFLGPNGAGKSTTLRTMLGFMQPTTGTAHILDLDVHRHPVDVRRSVGNLPSEFTLEDRMTGRDLLRLFARLRGIDERIPFAIDLAKRLDADLDRPMRRLSRGNKQKIGIIQALFHHPAVIVLDEPTGGLDPLIQETFLDLLLEAKGEGQTVFFSSHVLSEVERVADRVGIIREGELVAIERPENLTGRTWRRVVASTSRGVDETGLERLRAIDGVRDLMAEGRTIRFEVHAGMDSVVQILASLGTVQLDVERPSLEELFMTYYGRSEQ